MKVKVVRGFHKNLIADVVEEKDNSFELKKGQGVVIVLKSQCIPFESNGEIVQLDKPNIIRRLFS